MLLLKKYYKVKEKILSYLNKDILPILDGGEPMNFGLGYEAVSMDYIYRYVLKRRIRKSIVTFILIELVKAREIEMLPCTHADDILFCCKRNNVTYITYRVNENNNISKTFFGEVSDHFRKKWNALMKFYNKELNNESS